MANKKISELPYINVGQISGNTLVPLVTYFSASTGDTVHTYIDDFQTYLISGLTGNTDVFVTGGTYSAGTITFTNNTGGTFNVTGVTFSGGSSVSGDYLPLSGGTVTGSTEFTAGLSANTISATTYLNLPINTDIFVTGGTYSAGTSTFTNNTGGTFTVTGFYTGETSYVNSLTTGAGLSADTTTGDITIINTDPDQVVVLNNGTNINVTGTYPNFTIDVTGLTDFNTFTTGFTYSSNTFTISDNSGNTFDATFTEVTGLTVNGDLNITGTTYSNVISATTYQNLPDNVTGNYLPLSGGTVSGNTIFQSGLTANTISASTLTVNGVNITGDTYVTGLTFNTGNYNLTIGRNDGVSFTDSLAILASDLTVTGGTYDPNTGEATFTNNTGGTFIVTGFLTGFTDTYVTGGTYSNGTATFTNTSGGTFNVNGFYTGATDVFVTGGTFSAGTITFTNNTGGTFNVTGLTTGSTSTLTGVTSVGTGITIFDSIVDGDIKINSITGDTLEKITTSLSANTIQVGINEQNLTLWPLVVNGNRLIDGSVSYVSGLTFDISPLNYIIDGQLYNIPSSTQVTLNSGDSTFDRIDVIFANISGNTGVLEGTPSANPEKPIVDSETQVEVTFVSVPANSTTPAITTELIYDEFTGEPTEWNFLKFGNQTFRISGDSTAQSYSGSKSISVSGLTTSGGSWSNGFLLSATTATDTNQFATLQFAIRNMSGNSNNTQIRIRFLNQTGVAISSPVYLWGSSTTGQYVNYSTSNTSSWQLISIPLWKFYLTNTNVYGVRFDYVVGSIVARHYFDKIELVEGSASSPPSNSWTTIKGDSATTITAPNPNATLTISGGTNISSSISGTSTVVLNLDNNINLNSVTATTISATTYQNLPTDVRVTGGTYSAGTITFTNNTGGTFNVTGLTTGSTSTISGDFLPLSGGTVTGGTQFTAGLTANTISATTYQNLPISGLTEGNYINISGSNGNYTISVTGLTQGLSGDYLPLSGGTVTGGTSFESGLTANTIYITGNTFYSDTDFLVFRIQGVSVIQSGVGSGVEIQDSIGNTVFDSENKKLLDLSSATSVDWENRLLYKSGGTISFDWENGILTGQTNIQSSTISATTYQNLPDNVTGNYLPLSGGTVSGNTNITANLTVSGNSGTSWFSSNTSSDLVRITQTGVGNAFVVEDNTNPDSSPFVITSGGSVTIGVTEPFTTAGNDPTQLTISKGSSGVPFSGLPTSSTLVVQSNTSQSIGMLTTDSNSSQIYFGTPSDVFGSYLRWDYTNRNLILATANSTGKLIFQTANAVEVARIDQSGNMGIGLTGATQKLEVSGNTRIYGTLSADTISATTYQNLPNSLTGLYLPTSGGTVSGNTIFTSGLTASTTTINGNLTVTGNTNVRAFTGTTGYISGSGQNILTVIGSGNSTTSPLFSVQGSSGELFSVTDSLVGSLFSVNDISGLPIVEVFSDNTTLWGSYQAPSLNTTTRTSLTAGTNTIYSIPTSAYTGAFYEYTLISTGTTGARAGQIMSIWSGTSANFTETTTTDIGTTTGVTFTVAVSGSNAVLSSSATTAGWTVKTIIRSI